MPRATGAEFLAADAVVMRTRYTNAQFPRSSKAWIDGITVAGQDLPPTPRMAHRGSQAASRSCSGCSRGGVRAPPDASGEFGEAVSESSC